MHSDRINNIGESQTAKIAAIAIQMKRDKIDVVDLTVGEPDFPTPLNIKKAAIEAINKDLTRYTLIPGTIELRQAIIRKLKEDNNLEYDLDNIIVSSGAKQSIFNAVLTIVGKDDEVIIPSPYWVSYPEIVSIAEGKSVIISTEEKQGFKVTTRQLQDNITAKTRAIILCNPSNPTGAVYSKSELEALAGVLENENIIVISDEIYEKLIYDNTKFCSFASISPNMKKKTVVINGLSKAYAMTGWRIGYAAGEKGIIERASKLQGHCTTNAPSISQYASIEALEGPQDEIEKMHQEFERRRDFVYSKLQGMDGVSCTKPQGAFYAFPNISAYLNRSFNGSTIRNSYDLGRYLLEEARVILIPGAAFGSDNHIRISYTTSMERIEEGMNRIESALKKLKTTSK